MPYTDSKKQKAAQKRHYEQNRDLYIERAGQSRQKRREVLAKFLREYKSGKSCADCGETFHYCVMDFDHVRGQKVAAVGKMVNQAVPLKVLKEEISKCELVCANCHRLRTFSRGVNGGWKHGE